VDAIMIILYEEDEQKFSNLGLGTLKDALTCLVTESLNDEYTLEMNYPVNGANFSKIKVNRIIYCKPNPYSVAQPFRINSITRPIGGVATINAVHISYDLNNYLVMSLAKGTLQTVLGELQNGSIVECPFKFYTDITSTVKSYQTTAPANMRAILMGSDESLIGTYKCEVLFDKFDVHLLAQRGSDNGVEIRYGKNMTDLSHVSNYDTLYNGVYPYYHTESTTTTSTTQANSFKQAYVVGKKPLQDGWLSFEDGGEAYHPVDSSPVQIASDGDYKDKVYCWDTGSQHYVEKLYNQTVTLIEGVVSPDWIYIDWSSFPKVVCKAGKEGYFKTATDTNWGSLKKVGDTIFEGSITSSSTLSNIILYFSEVIPSSSSSETKETTNVTTIELDDKIIWLNTEDAKKMRCNRVLALDLTHEFESAPTKDALKVKAEEYIEKNKIGKIKESTEVSFVDLSSTTEASQYKKLERIELGDTVRVIYEDLGVDVKLRAITTEYNVLKNKYNKVKLGEKEDTISASSIQNGDNVSSLTNDAGYADSSTVNKLIANTVTAEYIQAQNAKLTQAQIEELSVSKIKCAGIIEASQFTIDKLVAKLLVADDAEIANTLTAGKLKVAGDVKITSGSILIENKKTGTVFQVDQEGNLTANSVKITGGELDIGDGQFTVDQDGLLSAKGANIDGTIVSTSGTIGGFTIDKDSLFKGSSGTTSYVCLSTSGIFLGKAFSVNSSGKLIASNAEITGKITSSSGKIGGFTIGDTYLRAGELSSNNYVYISTTGIKLGTGFSVDVAGSITAVSGKIGGLTLTDRSLRYLDKGEWNSLYIGSSDGDSTVISTLDNTEAHVWKITSGKYFGVDEYGKLYSKEAHVSGEITASSGTIGGFTIDNGTLVSGVIDTDKYVCLSSEALALGKSFKINKDGSMSYGDTGTFSVSDTGVLKASGATISGNISVVGGSIDIENSGKAKSFIVDKDGNLTASGAKLTSADISGKVTVTSGSLNINDKFVVDASGNLTASGAKLTSASVSGSIIATSGKIAGLTIEEKEINVKNSSGNYTIKIKSVEDYYTDKRLPVYGVFINSLLSSSIQFQALSSSETNYWIQINSENGIATRHSSDLESSYVSSSIPMYAVQDIPTLASGSHCFDNSNAGHVSFIYIAVKGYSGRYSIDLKNIYFHGKDFKLGPGCFLIDTSTSWDTAMVQDGNCIKMTNGSLTSDHTYVIFGTAHVDA
jgi:hypothetical protein